MVSTLKTQERSIVVASGYTLQCQPHWTEGMKRHQLPGLPNQEPHQQFYEKNIYSKTLFQTCGLCTKYKRLHLIPICLQRVLNLGFLISHGQLLLAAGQIAAEGGASEVGSQAFSDHSQLCNCDEASSRSHLPAEWKQRSAFTPHSRSHRHAARG